ncbi:MAG: hypothetical protein ACTHXA_04410 [Gulosibacter sp.]|uniref:hypothetical protein n=1 Tax=Gulosibacter sp. TaxID=2817531 RepID=UPI003F8DB0F9
MAGSEHATHAVEVDAAAEAAAVRSLECHREYLADLPWHPKPVDFIPKILEGTGIEAGVERAVSFRAFDLGGALKADQVE